jgi:hypothetical protein
MEESTQKNHFRIEHTYFGLNKGRGSIDADAHMDIIFHIWIIINCTHYYIWPLVL